jgi:haloalkane dehalogenase
MSNINYLRTPENRFENLVDYDYRPNYVFIDGLRMHYVDENKTSKKIIVLVHGEPTWGYLYRNMIPLFVEKGFRVIVPDLIGFGKSDKLKNKKEYTYSGSVKWFEQFLFEHLQLTNIHIVLHDWGGLIGLRTVANYPEKFLSVTAMNTALPRFEGINPVFLLWRFLSQPLLFIPFSKLIPLGIVRKISKKELDAYDAPFPDRKYKGAALQFPKLVPQLPWDKELRINKQVWKKLGEFKNPFLTIFSEKDPFTKRVEEKLIAHIPGALHQPHAKIANAGHLIQEDNPKLVSEHIISFIESLNKPKA